MTAPKLKPTAENVQVRKISPYPIEVAVIKEGPPAQGQIMKLTDVGFLMKVPSTQFYKVGENCQVQFELPVVHETVKAQCKVVKTYDSIEKAGGVQAKVRTIEMHFKTLAEGDRLHILNYLAKSGQKKS